MLNLHEQTVRLKTQGVSMATAAQQNNSSTAKSVGMQLRAAIDREAKKRKFTHAEVAAFIGCSKVYLVALLTGNRPIQDVSRNILKGISRFLDVPLLQVYSMAEILMPTDMICRIKLDDELEKVFRLMQSDPLILHLISSDEEWNTKPIKDKMLLAYLYQEANANRLQSLISENVAPATS